ncbi:MAG TPA: hypothetical protein VGW57_08980 [Chthoniobacterales bacterium]|nr:hypothetical protein [Chthoniobacterales bacterium]
MKRLLLVALFFPSVIALGGLDLSPFPSEFEGEGVKYTRLTFKEDKRQVNYVMPLKWTYRGSPSQLRLTPPPAFERADAIVEVFPLLPAQPLDEKVAVALRQQFLSSPPPGAQEVKLVSEEASPVLLNGNIQTWEFTMSYKVLGETFLRSTLYANVPATEPNAAGMQLRFRLSALQKDFPSLQRSLRSSLISWQWVEPTASVAGARKDQSVAVNAPQ